MEVLKKFLSTDGLRPWMCEVQKHNGWLFATNGYFLIRKRCSKKHEAKFKPSINTFSSIQSLFEDPAEDIMIILSIDYINLCESFKTEKDWEHFKAECKGCSGEGEIEWQCDTNDGETHFKDDVCPVCDGEGEVHERRSIFKGMKMPHYLNARIFNDVLINPSLLEKFAKETNQLKLEKTDKGIRGYFEDYEFFIIKKHSSGSEVVGLDIDTIILSESL